ncbi:MAG: DNA-binding response OmpR family regulator [Gammaproteobacteria bacterium]|jgi:DNA-binding response OmpR family regulator
MQILLIEDDQLLAQGISQALKSEGFSVNHLDRGEPAVATIKSNQPDIVILDLGLPDIDGLVVLKYIRDFSKQLPVLILTARTTLEDKVAGLDKGADDYLDKPFEMPELLARLRVLERRLSTSYSNQITIGQVQIDIKAHTVEVDDINVDLSRKEYMVLKSLMENAGNIQTRAGLEAKLYSWGEEVSSNALEVHIHHLRKQMPAGFITTVRGVGYRVNR